MDALDSSGSKPIRHFEAPHRWNVTPKAAIEIQQHMRTRVTCKDLLGPVRWVAGCDVGFEEKNRVVRAAVAVLSFPDLALAEYAVVRDPAPFPYVPGLLSFREAPAILSALSRLVRLPDLLLCDGQGIAHPRRLGIASHIGIITEIPTVGVAKKRLVGEHGPLPDEKGSCVPLVDRGEAVGMVLRSRTGVKPIYVSPGHRISNATATNIVFACLTRYRLPETTRWAHRLASNK